MARPDLKGLDEPVVQRSVDIELKSADRVGDVLYGVALTVGEVIHRVDAPFITGIVVSHSCNSVDNRVTHVDVR